MQKVYLAARFTRQAELRGYRDILQAKGYEVTSRWLDEPAEGDFDNITDEYRANCAKIDVEDVSSSDTIICFSGGPPGGGGRHTELGIAIALGLDIIIVGAREQIFHYLPGVMPFANWEHFMETQGG